MKLRIQGNAIRFRLNRREVGEFEGGGRVDASVHFAGGRHLHYVIETGEDGALSAAYENDTIRVRVPGPMARDWARSDQVGIHQHQNIGPDEALEIIIEKDFQCLHKGEAAKDPDAYPNPEA